MTTRNAVSAGVSDPREHCTLLVGPSVVIVHSDRVLLGDVLAYALTTLRSPVTGVNTICRVCTGTRQ